MATRVVKKPAKDTRVGEGAVSGLWVFVFSLLLIVVSVFLLYSAMAFWPPELEEGAAATDSTLKYFGQTVAMTRDQNLLLMVAVLGGLGAMAHDLRSFFKYAGERQLVWSWMASYLLIPFVGAVIAVVTYIVLRAGLVGGSGVAEGNTWGFAAVATLVGLFSAQATSKLKDIFETILTPAPKGGESIEVAETDSAEIASFTPTLGPVGTPVRITGSGLQSVTKVRFGIVEADAQWDSVQGVLNTAVPVGAASGPSIVAVSVDGVDVQSSTRFTVT